jgi:hypothetical protein
MCTFPAICKSRKEGRDVGKRFWEGEQSREFGQGRSMVTPRQKWQQTSAVALSHPLFLEPSRRNLGVVKPLQILKTLKK